MPIIEMSAKGSVIMDLEAMIAKLSDKDGSKMIQRFMTVDRAGEILKEFRNFLRSLLKEVNNQRTPESGFEASAARISEFMAHLGFEISTKSMEFYMDKIEELFLSRGRRIRNEAKIASKEDGLQAISEFREVITILGNGDIMSQMNGLDNSFNRILKTAETLEIKVADRKWISMCEKLLNETRCVMLLANGLASLAEKVGTFQLPDAPEGMFVKRKADITVCGITTSPSVDDNERLAMIDRPAIDRSQSHLYAYQRIDELYRENEVLREEIAKGRSDPEYVRGLRMKNERLTKELESLQEEYERLCASRSESDDE